MGRVSVAKIQPLEMGRVFCWAATKIRSLELGCCFFWAGRRRLISMDRVGKNRDLQWAFLQKPSGKAGQAGVREYLEEVDEEYC
ncbi:hypothetical protein VNO78_09343 [Psophocarpus tetragonolobus]|uniref:Uncharacterized protein n=1 Tax=Psophocarpus tetragonolobus TaxID=3891 RepID=A0AAN9SZ52_PSOTE